MSTKSKDVKPATSTKGGSVCRPIGKKVKSAGVYIIALLTMFGEGVNKSGRAGGVVIMKNGRQRQFKSPALRTTTATGRARGLFGLLSSAFTALSQATQLEWNAGSWKTSDRLGRVVVVSGRNAYIRLNANLSNTAQTLLDDAPALMTPAINLDTPHCVPISSAHTLGVNWTTNLANESQVLVYATSPQKSSIFSPKSGAFKLIGSIDGGSTSPSDLTSAYDVIYGTDAVVGVGKKIFLKLIAISDTGNASSPIVVSNTMVS